MLLADLRLLTDEKVLREISGIIPVIHFCVVNSSNSWEANDHIWYYCSISLIHHGQDLFGLGLTYDHIFFGFYSYLPGWSLCVRILLFETDITSSVWLALYYILSRFQMKTLLRIWDSYWKCLQNLEQEKLMYVWGPIFSLWWKCDFCSCTTGFLRKLGINLSTTFVVRALSLMILAPF